MILLLYRTQLLVDSLLKLKMKENVILLNFARAEIVDNPGADYKVLSENKIRNLGAPTKEAEENCAIMIAEQVQEFLEQRHIRNSINFPSV